MACCPPGETCARPGAAASRGGYTYVLEKFVGTLLHIGSMLTEVAQLAGRVIGFPWEIRM